MAVLTTACGSEGGDSSSDAIKGAGSRDGKTSASPSASASQGGVRRPEITLSKEFQADFENWTNSDPKLQAILNDGREELRSKYAAIIEADPESEAVAFYNADATQATARKWIRQFTDDDDTIIGKVRVFDPQVQLSDTGSGVLFYCVDERQASTRNRKTEKIVKTPDKPESLVQYRLRLDKSSAGVWRTTSLTTVPGACS
jgi:Asp-tRNA(Asn)/Glu-tRNA(Gln) amidotransferase A subunit family amidase